MDKYIYDENNGLWYERCGDYYLPCLALPEQVSAGKWWQKYKAYLRKHKREVYNAFQSNGTLKCAMIALKDISAVKNGKGMTDSKGRKNCRCTKKILQSLGNR